MAGALVLLSGTGTGIGKTHLGEALLLAWGAQGLRAAGLKPVESGVVPGTRTDAERLAAASTFHVKPAGVALAEPLSPHLAARRAGIALDPGALARWVSAVRNEADVTLVELPGGLFSPLSDGALNADFAAALAPDALLLAAPDRLGVLHEVIASVRAAASVPLGIEAVVLLAPETPDASTGTNARELAARIAVPVAGVVPRGKPGQLARGDAVRRLAAKLAAP